MGKVSTTLTFLRFTKTPIPVSLLWPRHITFWIVEAHLFAFNYRPANGHWHLLQGSYADIEVKWADYNIVEVNKFHMVLWLNDFIRHDALARWVISAETSGTRRALWRAKRCLLLVVWVYANLPVVCWTRLIWMNLSGSPKRWPYWFKKAFKRRLRCIVVNPASGLKDPLSLREQERLSALVLAL